MRTSAEKLLLCDGTALMGLNDELVARARSYADRHGLALGDRLGAGVHGIVFATECQPSHESSTEPLQSAIKAHIRQEFYLRERDVYLRLQADGIMAIRGCNVPQLLRWDDELWVIEMSMVSRPFVLDFAGAYLDFAPDFSEMVMEAWRAEKQEQFEQHWPEVQRILRSLEEYGIFMLDVSPGNISLVD